jgi:hypothetical protein
MPHMLRAISFCFTVETVCHIMIFYVHPSRAFHPLQPFCPFSFPIYAAMGRHNVGRTPKPEGRLGCRPYPSNVATLVTLAVLPCAVSNARMRWLGTWQLRWASLSKNTFSPRQLLSAKRGFGAGGCTDFGPILSARAFAFTLQERSLN